jgi:2-phosphoglycerate kinase
MSDSERKLEHVFWVGGAPCSGKSSISEVIASRFGLDIYHIDEAFELHARHVDPLHHPALTKWAKSSWDQRWMQPVESLVQEAIACYREHFTLVLEDILSLPKRKSLLVEGTALLPAQVANVLFNGSRAIWLVPTADFQRAHYSRREWIQSILAHCSMPEVAFDNWMERDIRFAQRIAAQTRAAHLELFRVDGSRTIEQNAQAVATHFQLCS